MRWEKTEVKCPDLQILSRYQDGGLDEESARLVREHLLKCSSCEERFQRLGKLGLFMRLGIGRTRNTPCLSVEELGTYVTGSVSPEHRERIEAHLAGCRECLHQVAIFSDAEFARPGETSPVPTRKALSEFALLNRRASRPRWTQRVAVHAGRVALVAAAALVIALIFPMSDRTRVTPVDTTALDPGQLASMTSGSSRDGMTMLARLTDEAGTSVSDHPSLARFARQMRLMLHQTTEAANSPTEDRLKMLKEDVLSSGLVNSAEELSGEIKDPRVQQFLVDCKIVLLKIAKIDEDNAPNDLIELVNEIQHMNLGELARLMELEGGGSLWLTASL